MLRIVLVAVVTLGVLGPVHAGSGTEAWLAWSSSSGLCGDAGTFAARVERALGRSPERAALEAHVNVIAHVAGSAATGASRWVGEVHLRGDDQRELGSRIIDRREASCQPLVDALAVVTALALADDGLASPEPATSANEGLLAGAAPETPAVAAGPPLVTDLPGLVTAPTPEAPAPARLEPALPPRGEPIVEARAQAQPPAPAPRRWRSGVEAGPTMGAGMLPRAAFGVEASAYLRPASGWKMFLSFEGWQRQTKLDDLGRGASFQRLTVGLGVCPLTVTRGRWDGAACVGGDIGRLNVSGVGFPTSSTEDRLTLDAGLRIELTRRLVGPLAAGLTAGITTPLIRDRISYATTDGTAVAIFRESPVAAIGAFRLSVAF